MSETSPLPVVFDCTVFAQALINPRGPAGSCLTAAQNGRLKLFVSDYVLREIRELPSKLPVRLGVDQDHVEQLIADLGKYAEPVIQIPQHFQYKRDPDDAHYVNLAIVTKSFLVVSRDKDLLDLMKDSDPQAVALRIEFPQFRVLAPPEFLRML